MSTTTSPLPAETCQSGPARPWFAVAAAGVSTFSVVTTEMLPVGLLTRIAADLQASAGTTGLAMSIPALMAALFAPVAVVAAGARDRRRVLIGLLALLAAANLASALAPGIAWLLAVRILVGLCMGGIWAIAGGLAARLVPPARIGTATAVIFGGVAAASVLGVPLGALVGDLLGWRSAFAAMALVCLVVLAANWRALPALPMTGSIRLADIAGQLRVSRLRLGLAVTLLIVAGHFMAFTFVRPMLQSVSHLAAIWVGPLLFAYGLAGIAGNFLAGTLAQREAGPPLATIVVALAGSLLLVIGAGASPAGGALALILWGGAYGGVSVSLQTWIMRAAPGMVEAGTALFVAAFNLGIAAGSAAGGLVVDGHGLTANLILAAGVTIMALVPALLIRPSATPPGP
ncbi:MFS transporter [Phreatobacter sp. AB_2022a]|uniref:MFS transporter n=1 Tax=Phreatobacter sp. AB_2022a TaxID=3003134 RepID=UPI002286DDC8|nr:MFS transporter [Phreatobacter sp. AB_2022a]MCZ0733492.1 MFS transporter [Phreatobacter sp. AB_2022a]